MPAFLPSQPVNPSSLGQTSRCHRRARRGPSSVRSNRARLHSRRLVDGLLTVRTLGESERDAIRRALEEVSGNRRRAAERLGLGEWTLYDKLKRYGMR